MTVIAWGGDGASGAGQRNPWPGRSRPRVPLPPLRAVRAGRAHRRDRGRAWPGGLPATSMGANARRRQSRRRAAERTETEIAGRAAARSHKNLDWRQRGRPSSRIFLATRLDSRARERRRSCRRSAGPTSPGPATPIPAGCGRSGSAAARAAGQAALNATTALVPPKAKLLLIAARTLRSRAAFGVTSRSQSGSGSL